MSLHLFRDLHESIVPFLRCKLIACEIAINQIRSIHAVQSGRNVELQVRDEEVQGVSGLQQRQYRVVPLGPIDLTNLKFIRRSSVLLLKLLNNLPTVLVKPG